MNELSQAATQAITDFTQRIGARELAEHHRHELSPTGEALRAALCTVPAHQAGELGSGKMFEKLIEQTSDLYHYGALHLEFLATHWPSKADVMKKKRLEGFLL